MNTPLIIVTPSVSEQDSIIKENEGTVKLKVRFASALYRRVKSRQGVMMCTPRVYEMEWYVMYSMQDERSQSQHAEKLNPQ